MSDLHHQCSACGHEEPPRVRRHPDPQVFLAWSGDVGSCNFCNRHLRNGEIRRHRVLVIRGSGPGPALEARICRACMSKVRAGGAQANFY